MERTSGEVNAGEKQVNRIEEEAQTLLIEEQPTFEEVRGIPRRRAISEDPGQEKAGGIQSVIRRENPPCPKDGPKH